MRSGSSAGGVAAGASAPAPPVTTSDVTSPMCTGLTCTHLRSRSRSPERMRELLERLAADAARTAAEGFDD
jgi:hypothetical protein